MGRGKIKVEVTLNDNRQFSIDIQSSPAAILEIIYKSHPQEISYQEIAAEFNPDQWSRHSLERYYEGFNDYSDEDNKKEVERDLAKIEKKVSVKISKIKRAFRDCLELSDSEVQSKFPFYYPRNGGDRKIARLQPIIKSIKFLD